MAMIVRVDGSTQTLDAEGPNGLTLEQMQTAVGGYIELVHLDRAGRVMVVNEEGHLHRLPVNRAATVLYQATHATDHTIVGDVVLAQVSNIGEDDERID